MLFNSHSSKNFYIFVTFARFQALFFDGGTCILDHHLKSLSQMPGIQRPTIHWYKKLTLRYVWMLAVAYCLLQVQHVLAASPEAFKFTKVDLELLQQTNQADNKLERNGLVFNDPETNTYLEQVGKRLIPETPLENVKWHFRVLRSGAKCIFSC